MFKVLYVINNNIL